MNNVTELLNKVEDLHPDLVGYVEDGPLGPSLRHPLIVDIMCCPKTYALINENYRHKKERAREAREAGDLDEFVWTHARPFRLTALLDWMRLGDDLTEKQTATVEEVWTDAENPSVNRGIWVELFEGMDCPALAQLPETFTIYRGTVEEDEDGISWTLNKKMAEFFANRFKTGVVKELEIRRSDALYYTNGRGEEEVIYDPTG